MLLKFFFAFSFTVLVFADNFYLNKLILQNKSYKFDKHILFNNFLRSLRERPKIYIDNAIKLFNQRKGKVIVEIGSMRFPLEHDIDEGTCIYCEDGHSTLLWARIMRTEVFSVDIDPVCVDLTKHICKDYDNVKVIAQDGIEFLKKFDRKIDLLYLDAWNVIPETNYAEKHLEAYESAKDKLHENSLILIDDTDIEEGGKGRLVVPKALQDGYKILFSGRQTLLSKNFVAIEDFKKNT